MKVLYGVQATGNGHITRARVMAPALKQAGVDVDYLFSGRPADELFDMELFGDYQTRRGLTFYMGEGAKVKSWDTLTSNSLSTLIRDIKSLDVQSYDLILSDFEPVTAWAAKLRGKKSIGIAHQYAFMHKLPDGWRSLMLRLGVQIFAPVTIPVGVHWDHFNRTIVPPLISPPQYSRTIDEGLVLVYLPFETDETLIDWFASFTDYRFHVYSKRSFAHSINNVHFKPLSRAGFEQDLAACSGVFSNCGFGLASETMQYGKKFLTKPMQGQSEQRSNAILLDRLQLATVMDDFQPRDFQHWLEKPQPEPQLFQDVAGGLAKWIAGDCSEPASDVVRSIWGLSTGVPA